MFSKRFVKILSRIGKPVVIRKKIGDSWIDVMGVAEIQKVNLKHDLVLAGVLDVGDAVAYFPPWVEICPDDRVILNHEYMVESVSRKQVGDETVYIRVLLKQTHETVQASFYGPNTVFYDDFDVNREVWTEKKGSWSIQTGRYVGESTSIALSVAGEEWSNYVLESLITVESGDAGLVCRFSSPSGIDQYYAAILRVTEGLLTLEAIQGNQWARLKQTDYALNINQQYRVRVHCFGGFLMLFLDGAYMFTVSDLGFKIGKIGAIVFGGKAAFDNITVWGET